MSGGSAVNRREALLAGGVALVVLLGYGLVAVAIERFVELTS